MIQYISLQEQKQDGNYSGLLTTFGGSQEFFAAGLAAAGCQARSKK